MGRGNKAYKRNQTSVDVLACKHCGKCYRTIARTEKIAKGLNISKVNRHKKVCESAQQGIVLPEELVGAIVNAYQNATYHQHSTNGYMREVGEYNYNTNSQTEHKDYDTH